MPEQAPIDFDISCWPIVVTTPRGATDTAAIDAFMEMYMEAIRPRHEPYISIVDLRFAGGMDASQRAHMQQWMDRCLVELSAPQVASVLVFKSRLMRNLLTGIMWVFKPKYPVKVFSELDEAMRWSREQLGIDAQASRVG